MVPVKERPMDNCQLFVQLQEMFHAYDTQTKPLTTFLSWSGNKEHIDELCTLVVDILLEHELVTQLRITDRRSDELQTLPTLPSGREAVSHLRGVLILLLVNTAGGQEVFTSPRCQHLCHQLPPLSRFLTVVIAMRCGLQQPLLEFLECGARWATNHYFDALDEALPHLAFDRMDGLTWISRTLAAAGHALKYHNFADDNGKLVRLVDGMLQRHLLDSAERLQVLHPLHRKMYLAEAMNLLLENLVEVLGDPEVLAEPPAHFDTYNGLSADPADADHQNPYLPDPVPYAKILLDALQRIVEAVSPATFMYWLEMPLPGILYNFQLIICWLSAVLLEAVQPYAELEKHLVCAQIKSYVEIAVSPADIVNGMTVDDLLTFLNANVSAVPKEHLLAVLEHLLNIPGALGDEQCVAAMVNHVELLAEPYAKLILTHLGQVSKARKTKLLDIMNGNEASDDSDDEEADEEQYAVLLRSVLQPIFLRCSIPEKAQLLKLRDDLGITNGFVYEALNHLECRTSFLNSLDSYSLEVEEQLLFFCYERADETWLALAKLAMTHTRYSSCFWRVALHCSGHAVNQMTNIAAHLLKDDQLLLEGNAMHFLLALYIHPLVLNGMAITQTKSCLVSMRDDTHPYGMKQLKAAQSGFLEACSGGLKQFTTPVNVPLLRRLLHMLTQLGVVEWHVEASGRYQLNLIAAEDGLVSDKQLALEQASHYQAMHELLTEWRLAHISLVTQLKMTIDALRWDLSHYDRERVDVLGMAVDYWRNNTNAWMYDAEFRKGILTEEQLPPPEDPNYRTAIIGRLTQASAWEATMLFRQSFEARTDIDLFLDLVKAVEQADCQCAEEAYIFLFGCYLDAINYSQDLDSSPGNRGTRAWRLELRERLASIVASSPEGTVPELKRQMDLLLSGRSPLSGFSSLMI